MKSKLIVLGCRVTLSLGNSTFECLNIYEGKKNWKKVLKLVILYASIIEFFNMPLIGRKMKEKEEKRREKKSKNGVDKSKREPKS